MFTLIIYFFETIKKFNAVCFCDAAESWQLGLQDPVSPVFEGMIFFSQLFSFFFDVNGIFGFLAPVHNICLL